MNGLVKVAVFTAMFVLFASAAQPVLFGFTGHVANRGSGPGDLQVNVSINSSCTTGAGIIYSEMFAGAVAADGAFGVTLGKSGLLKADYGKSYWLCAGVDGERLGNSTEFNTGQGEISKINSTEAIMINSPGGIALNGVVLVNGSSGNVGIGYTPRAKLTVGGQVYVAEGSRFWSIGASRANGPGGNAKDTSGIINDGSFAVRDAWRQTDVLRINTRGNVGIGVPAPQTRLGIAGRISILDGNRYWTLGAGRANGNGNGFPDNAAVDNSGTFAIRDAWRQTDVLRINSGGNVGIGTTNPAYLLDVAGQVNADCYRDGGVVVAGTCASDARLKTNVTRITGALGLVSRLEPVTYEYLAQPGVRQAGLIAQDAEEVMPQLVSTSSDGAKNVRYGLELEMNMLQAIRELKAENDALKKIVCKGHPEEKHCQ